MTKVVWFGPAKKIYYKAANQEWLPQQVFFTSPKIAEMRQCTQARIPEAQLQLEARLRWSSKLAEYLTFYESRKVDSPVRRPVKIILQEAALVTAAVKGIFCIIRDAFQQ